jgi:hypothetical protein
MGASLFTNILQVGIVVKDLDEAVKRYWHQYGIGPWAIYDFNPKTVKEMILHGKPAEYSMHLAMTFVGNVEIELMEPKDDKSIYAEFLKEHGEGLHHLAVDTQGYRQTVDFFEKKGWGYCRAAYGKHHGIAILTHLRTWDSSWRSLMKTLILYILNQRLYIHPEQFFLGIGMVANRP